MKLEIEVTEAEIKSAIERKIRAAIADETTSWQTDAYIKERIKFHWKEVADAAIRDACNDVPKLKAKIMHALEAKLKVQLNAVLKGTK